MTTSFQKTLAKYLPTPQSRKKFKRQCLKPKNILQQNQSIQLGCKIQKLYDFYTSKNYLQVNIFIGNKMSRPIERYGVEFRGTGNLQVYIEEKQEKSIKENTQGKERIVVEWVPSQIDTINSNGSQMLLSMSFTSSVLTLKDMVIPMSLWSFYNFPQKMQQIISPLMTPQSLLQVFRKKYQLLQEQQLELNLGLFRKGFSMKDMKKFLEKFVKIENNKNISTQGVQEQRAWFAGVFTVKTLLQEVGMLLEVDARGQEPIMKVTLAGNEYTYFEAVFDNIKFLFGK